MTLVTVHLVVYLAVNGLVLFIWVMTGGPDEDGFWPLWVMVPWGTGLAIHAGITLTVSAMLRRRRRGRRPGKDNGTTWIAAMFTDLVGSTRLAEQLGDDAWTRLISSYRRTTEAVASSQGGKVIGAQGDGLLVRFDSPTDALRCAGALQRRFARERDDGVRLPPVRIGIHAGEARAVDGDVLGQMVNLAARIADVAGPDEVLVSEPVADHAPPDVRFEDRGLKTLRGSSTPRHLLALHWRGYG